MNFLREVLGISTAAEWVSVVPSPAVTFSLLSYLTELTRPSSPNFCLRLSNYVHLCFQARTDICTPTWSVMHSLCLNWTALSEWVTVCGGTVKWQSFIYELAHNIKGNHTNTITNLCCLKSQFYAQGEDSSCPEGKEKKKRKKSITPSNTHLQTSWNLTPELSLFLLFFWFVLRVNLCFICML